MDAVNSAKPEPYTSASLGLADIEEWMRIFAAEHIIENFDAYGHEIGKNMYAYRPSQGKWQLYMFDLDWLMLAAQNHGYNASSAPLFNSEDPTIAAMYAFPPFARAYWRAILDAVNGPMAAANCNPVMDAKYASLLANGVAWCDGQALTDPTVVKTWFSQRLAFLQSQLATVAAPFTVNSTITVSNGLGVLTGTAPVGAYHFYKRTGLGSALDLRHQLGGSRAASERTKQFHRARSGFTPSALEWGQQYRVAPVSEHEPKSDWCTGYQRNHVCSSGPERRVFGIVE